MIKHFFTPYVVLEIVAAYFFIHAYGFLNLVLEVIATAILGLFFMFRVGFFQLTSNIAFFKPADVFSSVGMAIGGFFMFIPGLITDVLGVAIVAVAFFANLKNGGERARAGEFYREKFESRQGKPRDDGEIIDVEVVEVKRQIWKN
nr:FxsA family protein [uncultured Campylobacter sp.]